MPSLSAYLTFTDLFYGKHVFSLYPPEQLTIRSGLRQVLNRYSQHHVLRRNSSAVNYATIVMRSSIIAYA